MMKRIAVLLTVFNRKEKTLICLDSLQDTYLQSDCKLQIEVFLTDDGSTDGTVEAIQTKDYLFPIHIQNGTGSLFWNGGMNCSWKVALHRKEGYFDGYLWLNNDTKVLPSFWQNLIETESYSMATVGKKGIYVGSTYDSMTKNFTYGGFDYVNKWTLKDRFVIPNGKDIVACQCAHGNITYVSHDVVAKMGIFCDKYVHGGGDHDYTYQAYKHGFPIWVMKDYVGECENDHIKENSNEKFLIMSLKERWAYVNSPLGYNLQNSLLFNKRCFHYRYPLVWLMGYMRILFPNACRKVYLWLRTR